MKINITQSKMYDSEINEGLIQNSIKRYIQESKFPKNLLYRKLQLMSKNIDSKIIEIDKLKYHGENQIKLAQINLSNLWDSCNSILRDLRENTN